MAMHYIQIEYDDIRIMMAIFRDDAQLGRVLRAVFTHAVEQLDQIPAIGDPAADAYITKLCGKTEASQKKHEARSETNRNNAISGHVKQGHHMKQQEEAKAETAQEEAQQAARKPLMSKSDYYDLFDSLKHKKQVPPDRYEATKLYDKLQEEGWTYGGKAIEKPEQLEYILPVLLPCTGDANCNCIQTANKLLFHGLAKLSPPDSLMRDVIDLHSEIASTAEAEYDARKQIRSCMWTYDGHTYGLRDAKNLIEKVWADWSALGAEDNST